MVGLWCTMAELLGVNPPLHFIVWNFLHVYLCVIKKERKETEREVKEGGRERGRR